MDDAAVNRNLVWAALVVFMLGDAAYFRFLHWLSRMAQQDLVELLRLILDLHRGGYVNAYGLVIVCTFIRL
jgi:predicted deacylase